MSILHGIFQDPLTFLYFINRDRFSHFLYLTHFSIFWKSERKESESGARSREKDSKILANAKARIRVLTFRSLIKIKKDDHTPNYWSKEEWQEDHMVLKLQYQVGVLHVLYVHKLIYWKFKDLEYFIYKNSEKKKNLKPYSIAFLSFLIKLFVLWKTCFPQKFFLEKISQQAIYLYCFSHRFILD